MEENILSLEALKNMYQLVVNNLEIAKKKWDTKTPVHKMKLEEGDMTHIMEATCHVLHNHGTYLNHAT